MFLGPDYSFPIDEKFSVLHAKHQLSAILLGSRIIMASDSDTVCSYKELLDSEHDACDNISKPIGNFQFDGRRKTWHTVVMTIGWAATTTCCIAFALFSWHTSNELHTIRQNIQQSLNMSSDFTNHITGHGHQDGSDLANTIASSTVTIDGVDIPGYRLKYNASYCNEMEDPAGAPARGCVLDRVQGSWVPEICSDQELREEWDAMPDFGWYLDPERTQKISQERVYRGDPDVVGRSVYTSVNYHLNHCIAVLRLRNKNSLRRDRGLTFHMLSHHHIEHCYDRFLDWLTPEGINITQMPTEIHFSSAGVVENKDERTSECYVPV